MASWERRLRRRYWVLLLAAGLCASSAAAASSPPPPAEIQSGHCDDLDAESLVQALEAELPKLLAAAPSGDPPASPSSPAQVAVRFGHVRMRLAEYAHSTLEPLLALARRGRSALCTALPQQFELHRLAGPDRGHFSAYFHPLLHGSRTRHGAYQFPLYRRPPDPASQLTTAEIPTLCSSNPPPCAAPASSASWLPDARSPSTPPRCRWGRRCGCAPSWRATCRAKK